MMIDSRLHCKTTNQHKTFPLRVVLFYKFLEFFELTWTSALES